MGTLVSSDNFEVRKKAKISNRYNQVPHLTRDIGKCQYTRKHHIQESQAVKPFLAGVSEGGHETQITKMIHKRSTALERPVEECNWGLKRV